MSHSFINVRATPSPPHDDARILQAARDVIKALAKATTLPAYFDAQNKADEFLLLYGDHDEAKPVGVITANSKPEASLR